MNSLIWILGATLAMSAIAWVGLFALALKEELLHRLLLYLIAFAAGSLLGAAFLHLLPTSTAESGTDLLTYGWVLVGFSIFLLLEQCIHWHHCHYDPEAHRKPVTYLILLADGVHNFIGGLAIGGSFLVSVETGIVTWLAAAAHEIPQELGDFGILIHGGWEKKKALICNFLSALTVVAGGLCAFALSRKIDTGFLLPFAAGNFIYIASSDLIPEIKEAETLATAMARFAAFLAGVLILLSIKLAMQAYRGA